MFRKVLVPGLEANKTIYFTHKGVVTDSLECPDNKHRLKCLILCLNLLEDTKSDETIRLQSQTYR